MRPYCQSMGSEVWGYTVRVWGRECGVILLEYGGHTFRSLCWFTKTGGREYEAILSEYGVWSKGAHCQSMGSEVWGPTARVWGLKHGGILSEYAAILWSVVFQIRSQVKQNTNCDAQTRTKHEFRRQNSNEIRMLTPKLERNTNFDDKTRTKHKVTGSSSNTTRIATPKLQRNTNVDAKTQT